MPSMQLPYVSLTAGVLAIGVVAALDAGRALHRLGRRLAGRPLPPPVAASRGKRLAFFLLGAALGAGLVGAALTYERPIIERFHAVLDSRREVSERQDVRAVPGEDFSAAVAETLSANPVGRRVLDGLRDRGGVLRLPSFYVSKQEGSAAQHFAPLDAVYIDEAEIVSRGWTVERFLSDPAVQREFARRAQSTLLHELTHAVQGRRSPFTLDYYLPVMEAEYEAYVNELFYNHERLKADPSADLGFDYYQYVESLNDLAAYLRQFDSSLVYENNFHSSSAFWAAWREDLFARWPAHRAEGYYLLALRAHEAGRDRLADSYWKRAGEAAVAAGLPVPPELPKR